MRPFLATGLAAGLAGLPAAQPPVPPKVQEAREIVTYTEPASREAFRLCDGDADDRLSIFEATRAMPELGNPRDATRFRHLDGDRDGYLSWPEFDARLRQALRTTGSFTFQPARRLPAPPTPAAEESAAPPLPAGVRALLDLVDLDESGTISRAEFTGLLASAGLPPALIAHFAALDRDGNGSLMGPEIAGLEPALPILLKQRIAPEGSAAFPPEFRAADRNGDGALSVLELDRALRRVEPWLWRWAEAIVADADRSGDGLLGAAEILAARRSDEPTPGRAGESPRRRPAK